MRVRCLADPCSWSAGLALLLYLARTGATTTPSAGKGAVGRQLTR